MLSAELWLREWRSNGCAPPGRGKGPKTHSQQPLAWVHPPLPAPLIEVWPQPQAHPEKHSSPMCYPQALTVLDSSTMARWAFMGLSNSTMPLPLDCPVVLSCGRADMRVAEHGACRHAGCRAWRVRQRHTAYLDTAASQTFQQRCRHQPQAPAALDTWKGHPWSPNACTWRSLLGPCDAVVLRQIRCTCSHCFVFVWLGGRHDQPGLHAGNSHLSLAVAARLSHAIPPEKVITCMRRTSLQAQTLQA